MDIVRTQKDGRCNLEPRKRKIQKLAFLFHYNELEEQENVAVAQVIILKVQVSNSGKGKRKKLNKEVARNVTKKFEGEKKIGN